MRTKTFLLIFIIVVACLLALSFFLLNLEKQEKKKEAFSLAQVSIEEGLNFSQNETFILKGIETSLKIYEKRPLKNYLFFGRSISSKEITYRLKRLKKELEGGLPIYDAIKRNFIFFKIKRGEIEPKLLLTGYYQPEFEGSLKKDELFKVPVLKRPNDLIHLKLKDFDKHFPAITLWGRLEGQRVVPYFTRKEIEEKKQHFNALCWLKDPVDLLELQIQGSGIITINGKRHFIHYAASNGRPYFSIGKELLKRKLLKKEQLSWQEIKKWAKKEPQLFKEILNKNQRYIFFKWERQGPIGCFGKKIVEGVSAAFDQTIYPPGIPIIIKTKFPTSQLNLPWFRKNKSDETAEVTLLLFNHDSGGAIKGPLRADLYSGSGTKALELAGKLKGPSELIILLPKTF